MVIALPEPQIWLSRGFAAAAALVCLNTIPMTSAASPIGVLRSGDMIRPLPQVQSIVGGPTLHTNPNEDLTSPWVDHSMDATLSAPCRHFVNQDEVFGSTWSNFASARYSGSSNIGVRQSVAVYPDANTARRTFDALKTAARQCRTHPSPDVFGAGFTLTEPEPSMVLIQYPDSVNGPGSVDIDALRGRVLIEIGAAHFSTDPRIAQTVLTLVAKKVP
ncbi:sensor domain-containing protein [Mycolicibacterium llatzerense]|uniref:sensor domain-containing protein n=1 Tax=Mycolicibacterium llatzerense TaxID=280871 RepID=UPI0006973569|nr:sensor domain-containing protein [Mycolicibacterium llatzerense]